MEYSDWVRLSANMPPIGGLPLAMPGIILDRCRTNSVLHHSYIPGGVLCFVRLQAFLYLNLLHTDFLFPCSLLPMMLDILTSFAPHPIARSCSEIYSLVPLDVLHVVAIYHFGSEV